MTITLDMHVNAPQAVEHPFAPRKAIVRSNGQVLAYCDTREEAEQVKSAFENVLAPRFTRDEAIAIVLETMPEPVDQACEHHLRGIRLTLEALAAAGAFSDDPVTIRPGRFFGKAETMADKLDAAGIK